VAAACSWFGVIHAWQFSASDTTLQLGWGVGAAWAQGYLAMAAVFAAASLKGRLTRNGS
jgi:AGZA family xanthine/uracil permease-like MFS transporter